MYTHKFTISSIFFSFCLFLSPFFWCCSSRCRCRLSLFFPKFASDVAAFFAQFYSLYYTFVWEFSVCMYACVSSDLWFHFFTWYIAEIFKLNTHRRNTNANTHIHTYKWISERVCERTHSPTRPIQRPNKKRTKLQKMQIMWNKSTKFPKWHRKTKKKSTIETYTHIHI